MQICLLPTPQSLTTIASPRERAQPTLRRENQPKICSLWHFQSARLISAATKKTAREPESENSFYKFPRCLLSYSRSVAGCRFLQQRGKRNLLLCFWNAASPPGGESCSLSYRSFTEAASSLQDGTHTHNTHTHTHTHTHTCSHTHTHTHTHAHTHTLTQKQSHSLTDVVLSPLLPTPSSLPLFPSPTHQREREREREREKKSCRDDVTDDDDDDSDEHEGEEEEEEEEEEELFLVSLYVMPLLQVDKRTETSQVVI